MFPLARWCIDVVTGLLINAYHARWSVKYRVIRRRDTPLVCTQHDARQLAAGIEETSSKGGYAMVE